MSTPPTVPEYHEKLNDPHALRAARDSLRRMLHAAKSPRERAKWKDRLETVHLELQRQEQARR